MPKANNPFLKIKMPKVNFKRFIFEFESPKFENKEFKCQFKRPEGDKVNLKSRKQVRINLKGQKEK